MDVLLTLVAAIICFLLCLIVPFTVYIHLQHRKYAHIPGPPNKGIKGFYLGQLPAIQEKFSRGSFFSEIFLEWHLEYGRIFCVFFLHKNIVATSDQAAIKDVLVTGGLPKSPQAYDDLAMLFGQRFLGIGLVTDTNHERWAKRRLQMNPAFNRGYLKSLMTTFNSTADALIDELAKVADGKTSIRMMDYMNRVTLDVIGKVAFSQDIDSIHDPTNPFPEAIFNSFNGLSYFVKNLLRAKIPWADRDFKKKSKEAVKLLRNTGFQLLQKREEEIDNGENVPEDILTQVCRYKAKDPDFDLEAALDDFVTFFVAGQETTANTMCFILMECGRRPEIMEKLRDEVDSLIGDNNDITYENIMNLEYCTMVFKETLRLYPAGAQTFRATIRDQEIAGYTVPKDTCVGVSMYAVQRLPEFHEDPLKFDPERFEPHSSRRPSMYTFLPFSLGPRNCLGQTFAQIEAKMLLAKFVQKFDLHLDMNQSFDIKEVLTLKPKDGCMCTLTPRNK